MKYTLLEQIFSSLDDLGHDFNCHTLLKFSTTSEVTQQIPIRTVFSDNETVRTCFVDLKTFDNVRVV